MDWHEYLNEATKGIDNSAEAAETRHELLSHLTLLMDELLTQGMNEESARAEAVRRMGAAEDVREQFQAVHNPSKLQKMTGLYETELQRIPGNLSLKSLLKVEFKRALAKWQVGLMFLLILGFFTQGYLAFRQYNHWLPVYNAYMAFLMSFDGPSAFLIGVLPLFVSVAAGDSLAWDRNTGFIKYILPRTSFRKYILSKILASSAISFAIVLSAELVSFVVALIVFPTKFTHQAVNGGTPHNLSWLYVQNPILYVGLVALVAAIAAMVFALTSVILSTKITNTYVVIAGPWVLYIVLSVIFQQTNLLLPFAPLTMLGQYFMLGNAASGYVLQIPLIWAGTWLLGALVAYAVFSHTFAYKKLV